MALNLPVFYTRTASAVVFAAIMLTGLLGNVWLFCLLFSVIQGISLYEYRKLVLKMEPDIHFPVSLLIVMQLSGILLLVAAMGNLLGSSGRLMALLLLLLVPVSLLLWGLFAKRLFLRAALYAIAGIGYIGFPVAMLVLLKRAEPLIPLYLILLIWTNDTMAYLVGSFIGKTPLSPISPKKTWEGTGGGALLTIAGGLIYGYYSHTLTLAVWAVMALIVALMGNVGDLMESKLKRLAGVKDSGSIMPGHGGALDRFDSLLVATPFVFVFLVVALELLPRM